VQTLPTLAAPAAPDSDFAPDEDFGHAPLRISRRSAPAGVRRRDPEAPRVESFERIEDYLLAYLEGEPFSSAHPLAHGRWLVAWQSLWCADSKDKLIAVGGKSRAALQAYSTSLQERHLRLAMNAQSPRFAEVARRAKPLEGLSSVVEMYRPQLGGERCELLHGLFEHWSELLAVMRRHEEGRQQAGERLRWEDGRRLVLFTAVVIVEIDRSFTSA
jgi:hypothetical protein